MSTLAKCEACKISKRRYTAFLSRKVLFCRAPDSARYAPMRFVYEHFVRICTLLFELTRDLNTIIIVIVKKTEECSSLRIRHCVRAVTNG